MKKKSLCLLAISLLSLSPVLALDHDDTWTIESNQPGTHTLATNKFYYGFRLNISSNEHTKRFDITPTSPSIYDYDKAQYCSVTTNVGALAQHNAPVYLIQTTRDGKVLAVSDNGISTLGTSTWTFNNSIATIDTSDHNYFVFSNTNNITIGTHFDDTHIVQAGGSLVGDWGQTPGSESLVGIGKSNENYNVDASHYAPIVTIQLCEGKLIPEPSTATLGLLGLSFVLLRRRVKKD